MGPVYRTAKDSNFSFEHNLRYSYRRSIESGSSGCTGGPVEKDRQNTGLGSDRGACESRRTTGQSRSGSSSSELPHAHVLLLMV